MPNERDRVEIPQTPPAVIETSSYWRRVKGFARKHKRNLVYGGSILGVTLIAGGLGLALRPPSIPEGTSVVIPGNQEFEISYACVPNKFAASDGTKHIEITVTSSTYRTSYDPNDVLVINWDDGYSDQFKQYDQPRRQDQVPPRLFQGRALGTFERARGYVDYNRYPLNSMAEVEVKRGVLNPQTREIEVITRQTAPVPRNCT